jgi:predicted ATPase
MVERDSHYSFPYKTIKPGKYDREKHPFEMFTLFSKDFEIKLEPLTVIVGENGCGKTTFLDILKKKLQKSEKDIIQVFTDEDNKINASNFIDSEKDNPREKLQREANPFKSDYNDNIMGLFQANQESHGESMINVMEIVTQDTKNTFLVFDEPENGLSIGRQYWFFDVCKKLIDSGNQIIISTHSESIIKQVHKVYDMQKRGYTRSSDYIKRMEEQDYNLKNKK